MKTLRATLCNPATAGAGVIGLFFVLRSAFGFPTSTLGTLFFLAAFGYGSLLVFLVMLIASDWFRWQVKANDASDPLYLRLLMPPARVLLMILLGTLVARHDGNADVAVPAASVVIALQVTLSTVTLFFWQKPEELPRRSS